MATKRAKAAVAAVDRYTGLYAAWSAEHLVTDLQAGGRAVVVHLRAGARLADAVEAMRRMQPVHMRLVAELVQQAVESATGGDIEGWQRGRTTAEQERLVTDAIDASIHRSDVLVTAGQQDLRSAVRDIVDGG